MAPHAASVLLGALLAAAPVRLAHASQPGAAPPVAAPMRNLTWGQLNFLHTTDTHGWLGGHLQEPQYSADWGDYVSFAHHMRRRADAAGADLLVIDTGDRVEGNGLYDASRPRGRYLYDVLAAQGVDVLTVGNHELYRAETAARERNTTLRRFADAYVASNVNYTDPRTGASAPLAPRYRRLRTRNLGLDVLVLGFLFDFAGNAANTAVQPVEEALREPWFQSAMRERPDLFVVAGHAGLRMPEFRAVFTALRRQNWHILIVFFGGHAHVRDALSFDSLSFAIASGRYLETIGWMSVDGIKPKHPKSEPEPAAAAGQAHGPSPAASLRFSRTYMDNNLLGMYHHTGLNASAFATEAGARASGDIARARTALRLDDRYGCAPRDLWVNRAAYPGNASIYSWLQREVLPDVVVSRARRHRARLVLLNTGGVRFDVFRGPFTRDTIFAVSPFANAFRYVPDVPYAVAQKVLGILNSAEKVLGAAAPDPRTLAVPQQQTVSAPSPAAAAADAAAPPRRLELRGVPPATGRGSAPDLIPGYTTTDDIGSDGDDTVHEPVAFHRVPNCIQAEVAFPAHGDPDTVDLVFVDFIQPWIVPALKFSGGDYTDADVRVYMEETLTHKLAEWVEHNWQGDC